MNSSQGCLARAFVIEKENVLQENDVSNIFVSAALGDLALLIDGLKHWGVNSQDNNKMTVLHHASGGLRYEVVDYLLELENIDATLEDKFGRSAAWVAVEVYGDDVGKKMYDKLAPYCYPIAEEDRDLYADDAPTNEELNTGPDGLG